MIAGVDLGPARNLSDQPACDFLYPMDEPQWPSGTLVEVCVCTEDLCNTYIDGKNSSSPEAKAAAAAAFHFTSRRSWIAIIMILKIY